MGKERAACCEKIGLNKGAWTPKEDMRLTAYVQKHGHANWPSLPKRAGLARCGKSCRLRWMNYLRPGLKRGNFTKEEEETIIKLHEMLGNKWSKIAARLPGRTDNEIKNVWNTHIKKRFEPKESKLSRNKKDGEAPTTSSQSVSCSDVGSVECDHENSSDEKNKILIELEECLTFKELIEHTESTDNYQISSPSVSCSASSEFKMEGKQESCHTEKNNILIELEQSLAFEGFEISVNDYQIAPSQMDMHAYSAEINQPMFSSPSFSCSNPTTNTDYNTEECKQDANILIKLEESLASPELLKLSVNDYHVYANSAENNQPITSPSFSSSNCIANSKFDIKCGQDPPDEKKNFLIKLDQCLPSTDYELSGNIVDCQISSSGASLQTGLDLIMDIPEVPIGPEIWSILDDDSGGNGNSTAPRTLEESSNFRQISTIEENLRVVENKRWLGYLEKLLELC